MLYEVPTTTALEHDRATWRMTEADRNLVDYRTESRVFNIVQASGDILTQIVLVRVYDCTTESNSIQFEYEG